MRILNMCLTLLLLIPAGASAQARGGLLGGINLPKFSDQSRYDSDKRFQAGILGSRNFGWFLAVQGEVYYSELASTAEQSTSGSVQTTQADTAITSIRLDYFEAPGLVRFNLLRSGAIYVAAGGAIGVQLKCALTITAESVEREDNCEYAGRDLVEDVNFAPVFGAGVQGRFFGQLLGGDIRIIGGWEDMQNVGNFRLDRAFERYSLAVTGRFIPVIK